MPCRRSQVRSSKPFDGPRGSRTTASRLTRAPWGGARPSGSSSWTSSSTRRVPKRLTRAKMRCWNIPTRGSAVTTADTRAARSTSASSGLRSSASSRALPHHQPAAATRSAPTASVRRARRRREDEQPRGTSHQLAPALEAHEIGQTEPGHRSRGDDVGRKHSSHGTTSPCSSEIRAGPMPGIASSPSTERERAVLLPVGDDLLGGHRADSGQRVELLGGGRAERDRAAPLRPRHLPRRQAAPRAGTSTCSPSETSAARLTPLRSARRVSPPARAIASATRAPFGRRTRPGLRTAPATSTTSAGGEEPAEAAAEPGAGAAAAGTIGATRTASGALPPVAT